jgi:hypothetical protein
MLWPKSGLGRNPKTKGITLTVIQFLTENYYSRIIGTFIISADEGVSWEHAQLKQMHI